MRVLGIMIGFVILLLVRAELQHVGDHVTVGENSPPIVPSAPPVATVDTSDINPVTPALQKYAQNDGQIATQSQIDRQMQQTQAAQDRALQTAKR